MMLAGDNSASRGSDLVLVPILGIAIETARRYSPGQGQEGVLRPVEASQAQGSKPVHASPFRDFEACAPERGEGPPLAAAATACRELVDRADLGPEGPCNPPNDRRDNPQAPSSGESGLPEAG